MQDPCHFSLKEPQWFPESPLPLPHLHHPMVPVLKSKLEQINPPWLQFYLHNIQISPKPHVLCPPRLSSSNQSLAPEVLVSFVLKSWLCLLLCKPGNLLNPCRPQLPHPQNKSNNQTTTKEKLGSIFYVVDNSKRGCVWRASHIVFVVEDCLAVGAETGR